MITARALVFDGYRYIIDRTESLRGLPFPFGYPAKALGESDGGSWSSDAINIVAKSLVDLKWCPPVLFGGRGDQWPQPISESENMPVAYIASGAHLKFGTVYMNRQRVESREDLKIKGMSIVYEMETWGAGVFKQLESKYVSIDGRALSRAEMLSAFKGAKADLVLSYFPLNSLIDENIEEYSLQRAQDIYQTFEEDGQLLVYDLPSTILASGLLLSKQAKMASLIEDLAIYLHKTETTFRHLSPAWDGRGIAPLLQQVASGSGEEREDAALRLSVLCEQSVRNSILFKKTEALLDSVTIRPNQLQLWAQELCEEMIRSILPDQDSRLKCAFDVIRRWGWANLLPFIRDMSVYVSCDLSSPMQRSKKDEI